MGTAVGVGYSEKTQSFEAGAEAAEAALAGLEGASPNLALLFSTSAQDPAKLAAGIKSVIGADTPLVGGYAVGIITNEELSYDGYEVGLALFASGSARFDIVKAEGLPHNEENVGRELGDKINALGGEDDKSLVLLYDSVNRTETQFNLNMAVPLLKGLSAKLTEPEMQRLVGAGLVGDMACRETFQWCNDEINQGTAMALSIQGLSMYTTVLHGCRPASDYHTVTKSDGPTVLEIDDRPALEVISELLGEDQDVPWKEYSFFVTLGVNKGEKYGDFDEELYQNRLCLRADLKRKGLMMFEPDLVPGTEIQLMRRSLGFGYMGERIEQLLASIPDDKTPVFALYIDCAGRAAAYCGADEEEAAEVIEALGEQMPLLGMYSGVEIGQIGGAPQSLDWTGVLTVFCE